MLAGRFRTKFQGDDRLRSDRGGGGFLFRGTSSSPGAAVCLGGLEGGPESAESRAVKRWRQTFGLCGRHRAGTSVHCSCSAQIPGFSGLLP